MKTTISSNETEKNVSLEVKCVVRRNPGLTRVEIIDLLQQKHPSNVITSAITRMRDNDSIIIRNDRYYVLGPPAKTKVRNYKTIKKQLINYLEDC